MTGSKHTTNDLLAKLLQQLRNMRVNNNNTIASHSPLPVAYQSSPNTYAGLTTSPSYPPSYTQPAQQPWYPLPVFAGPNSLPPPGYFMLAQPVGIPLGSTVTSGQATTLPQSFTVRTLHDPASSAWNMDTDFMTRRVLLRCDSTRDLYPVTAPSLIPQVFLVSQHTWHQRLRHPRSDVLRRLVSNNFILCNKEKPLALYHACQLGKQARLPFVSYNTEITSCFEIIHSDVWTLPIPSLSGFKYCVFFLNHYS
ncbi:ribonuclease H-like domain-containing protein [Tanacetum coccineum]